MKKLALMTLVLAVFCSALSFAGYVGFEVLAGKVPTPVHVRDSIATTNDLEQLRAVSLDAIRDNDRLLESMWKLTLSILLFTAIEFTIISILLVFVFREMRKAERADTGRPQASPGQTLTIDSSTLAVRPGARVADYQLSVVLRSSRGIDHNISLPAGAILKSISINGQPRPIRANGRLVTLPIVVFSSSDLKEDVAQAYALGANSYVMKPSAPERLERMVRALHEWWTEFNVAPSRL